MVIHILWVTMGMPREEGKGNEVNKQGKELQYGQPSFGRDRWVEPLESAKESVISSKKRWLGSLLVMAIEPAGRHEDGRDDSDRRSSASRLQSGGLIESAAWDVESKRVSYRMPPGRLRIHSDLRKSVKCRRRKALPSRSKESLCWPALRRRILTPGRANHRSALYSRLVPCKSSQIARLGI
jgi:hypothetical protein